ncbi:MAG: hypothetical protein K9L17_12380 [Clostridiales bacterium]|nr:hypothetical protein [Clostridiales bacterium]MCF8023479.1 hypothetical protein [Clostridiales bacterium]
MNLYWLTQAAAYWALVLFLVPSKYIKKFLLFAFVAGFVYTWIVQLIAVNVLDLWHYRPDIFTIWGIPFFFVLSWFGVTLVYGYLLFKYPGYQLWTVIFFVSWALFMSLIAKNLGHVSMPDWSTAETFMFAIFSHILLLYIFKLMHNVKELGTKDDTIKFSLSALKNR